MKDFDWNTKRKMTHVEGRITIREGRLEEKIDRRRPRMAPMINMEDGR